MTNTNMKITIVPASSKAGVATIRTLLNSSHPETISVRGIYRNLNKVPEEFKSNPRFEAVHGNVGAQDADGIDLGRPDAVMYISPYTIEDEDNTELATRAATNIKTALVREGSVKRLLVQSALGSQYENTGVLKVNRIADTMLKGLAPRTFIVRPCTFFDFWVPAVKAVQSGETTFDSYISPAEWAIPMVSIRDVGEYCAKVLVDEAEAITTNDVKIFGPRLYSSNDVRDAIATVTGRSTDVRSVPKDELRQWWRNIVAEKAVDDMTEFVTCQLEGTPLQREYAYDDHTIRGKTELVDELRESL